MKDSIKNRKKRLLALCLSALMLSSVAALAACKGRGDTDSSDSSSSSTSSSTQKDDGLIKNAGFETFNEDNAMNTSVTGWTRSLNSTTNGSAPSSNAASGIVDLDTEAWKNLTGSYFTDPDEVKTLTEEKAEALWDELTVRDKLAYYDQWNEDNDGKTISKELDFYETINISTNDIPTFEHFDTHDNAVASDAEEKDTKVLMIHNENPKKTSTSTNKSVGTAQKYTSTSTVTVKAGTTAQFSVWVKTADLTCSASDGSTQAAVGKGAYISLTHSVGGKSLDAYKVENINTDTWTQYSFLLRGSSFTDTTFTLVLGLGQGGGTYRGEYVNGYAFFDDIQCEIISSDEFDGELEKMSVDKSDVVGFEHEGDDKIVDISKVDKTNFALDFSLDYANKSFSSVDDFLNDVTYEATTSTLKDDEYSSLAGPNVAPWLNGGISGDGDVVKTFSNATAIKTSAEYSSNKFLKSVYDNYIDGDLSFAENENILLMLSTNGVAYTAEPQKNGSPYTFSFSDEVEYIAISFFVKTSDFKGKTGAGITLVDQDNKTSFVSIDTTDIDPVTIGENEDVYDGWQQCFFFVQNTAENTPDATFSLYFTLGPTSIENTSKDDYYPGFAAFTDFKAYAMSKEEYETAQASTYAKLVSVTAGEDIETSVVNGFDSVKSTPSSAIKEGLANPQNYKGVYGDSAYILGSGDTAINQHANAGLINKEYFLDEEEGYFHKALNYYKENGTWEEDTPAWLIGLAGNDPANLTHEDLENIWNERFGDDSSQPLYIWNDAANAGKAYGYIGDTTTISANTYTVISVRVRGNGSTASVYLVDMDADDYDLTENAYDKLLSIGSNLTFWYDAKGNIWNGDPSESATKKVFNLESNGLYKANKNNATFYNSLENPDAWYANLSAYTKTDDNGNLLVGENGASHDYNDYWNNEGMNGIAFYKGENGYYADPACKVLVRDLAELVDKTNNEGTLKARFLAEEKRELSATVTATEEWTYINFYIHTGDLAKTYRLEVWSGEGVRTDGVTGNGEGKYVVFDTNNPGTAETNFTSLLEEYDDYDEADKDTVVDKFESVFSYFDTENHLRYDETLDENDIGNLYEDNYDATAQTEGIAYLRYHKGNTYTVLADYQYAETSVTASSADSDSGDSDTDDDEESDTNVWLLISSLAVAGVLLLAIASIVIRKIVIKVRKQRAAQGYVPKKKKSKK